MPALHGEEWMIFILFAQVQFIAEGPHADGVAVAELAADFGIEQTEDGFVNGVAGMSHGGGDIDDEEETILHAARSHGDGGGVGIVGAPGRGENNERESCDPKGWKSKKVSGKCFHVYDRWTDITIV